MLKQLEGPPPDVGDEKPEGFRGDSDMAEKAKEARALLQRLAEEKRAAVDTAKAQAVVDLVRGKRGGFCGC